MNGTPLDDAFFCGVIPEKRSEQIAREAKSSPLVKDIEAYSPNPNKKKRKKGRR